MANAQTSSSPGRLWVLTGIAYEMPSSEAQTTEFGLGWYGFGGGINHYLGANHMGASIAAHVGVISGGVGFNAQYNYTGQFNPTLLWRVGAGIEHFTGRKVWGMDRDTFPFIELSVGVRL